MKTQRERMNKYVPKLNLCNPGSYCSMYVLYNSPAREPFRIDDASLSHRKYGIMTLMYLKMFTYPFFLRFSFSFQNAHSAVFRSQLHEKEMF